MAAYLPAVNAYFVGDDWDFLVADIGSLGSAIRHTFWGVYMPVFSVSFWLDGQIWGFWPTGYHLTSFAFHALATTSAFFLARALADGDRGIGSVCALLFALHPVHDEAVIYIAARAHLACTAFMLGALYFHVRNRQTNSLDYLGRAVLCFVVALLSKETALVTPVLVVAVDLLLPTHGPARIRGVARGVRPFALVSAAYLLVRRFMAAPSSDKLGLGWFDWEPLRLVDYFLLEFLPIPATLLDAQSLGRLTIPGALLAIALAVWAWRGRRRWSTTATRATLGLLPFALTYFVVTTLPFLADSLSLRRRYAYPASFGACLFIAVLVMLLLRSSAPMRRRIGTLLLAALFLAFAGAGLHRAVINHRSAGLVRNIAEDLQTHVAPDTEKIRLRLLQLPRWSGGGPLRGAYLLHATDLKSIVTYFRGVEPSLRSAFKLRHAEDHSSRAVFWDPLTIAMRMTSRTPRAAASLAAEVDRSEENELGTVRAGKTAGPEGDLRVYLQLERAFEPDEIVLYYSDGHLHRLEGP